MMMYVNDEIARAVAQAVDIDEIQESSDVMRALKVGFKKMVDDGQTGFAFIIGENGEIQEVLM